MAEGRLAEALSLLRSLSESHPGIAEIYQLAGDCLLQAGDAPAALGAFRRAAGTREDWPDPYIGAARALARTGDASGAMQALLRALDAAPGHRRATTELVDLLSQLHPESHLPALEPALLACFSHPDVDPTPLARLCAGQLRFKWGDAGDPGDDWFAGFVLQGEDDARLLRRYLCRVVNCDPQLEIFLTRLRRYLCLHADLENPEPDRGSLIAALGQQCFLNEYVFVTTAEESRRLVELEQGLAGSGADAAHGALVFALLACYRAPSADDAGRKLGEELAAKFAWLDDILRLSVFEPAEEARLEADLPTLRPVANACSLAVQAHYEANPYPRWQGIPAPAKSAIVRDLRRRFSRHGDSGEQPGRARVLVAGCGTGYEPIDIALRDSELAVTAVDLSRRSLAYAKRKAESAGCSNIEFIQADLLDLGALDGAFDLVVCTGVLHHMEDPMAGWAVLRDRLAPGGMMRISLYSAHARRSIRAARETIAARDWSGEPQQIRAFRRRVLEAGPESGHAALLQSDDFYSMSGCRDLLFHVQEQQFTLPEVRAALDRLELCFCGFDPPDASLLGAFAEQYGGDALLDLERWDRFEQDHPDIFAGMYQFWCQPKNGEIE
jgi:SAM-dependent methyltransferase